MQLFYSSNILQKEYFLQDEEARHCSKVLRKKIGDIIQITDGVGHFYDARLTDIAPKKCQFEIINSMALNKPSFNIHIAIAPTKNIDRTEWFVEKAIEIGVNEISFLVTNHSERNKINIDRINKKAVSAIKQSVRPYLPQINEIQKIGSFLKSVNADQKFVAHLDESSPSYLSNVANHSRDYLVMIGPEGGFSNDEIDLILKNDFIPVRLGDHRLRTETAGVTACAILNSINHQ